MGDSIAQWLALFLAATISISVSAQTVLMQANECKSAVSQAENLLRRNLISAAKTHYVACSRDCTDSDADRCNEKLAKLSIEIPYLINRYLAIARSTEGRLPGLAARRYRAIQNDLAPLDDQAAKALEEAQRRIPILDAATPGVTKAFADEMRRRISGKDFAGAGEVLRLMFENEPDGDLPKQMATELATRLEAHISGETERALRLLGEMDQLAKAGRPTQEQKRRAEENLQQINAVLERNLVTAPGNSALVHLNDRFNGRLAKEARTRLGVSTPAFVPSDKVLSTPMELRDKAISSLRAYNHAATIEYAKALLSAAGAGPALWSDAHIVLGLVHATQIPDNAPNSPAGVQLQTRARSDFSKAIRLHAKAVLPQGYSKYSSIFDEAKNEV